MNVPRYTTAQAAADTREKLLSTFQGKLATVMRPDHELAGYPINSVVPYVLDADYRPIILISQLADHTKNLAQDSRASLLLHDQSQPHEVQTTWRIALIGDIHPIEDAEVEGIAERYYQHFPNTRDYHRVLDFSFHRLHIHKAHTVMGFGQISWVPGEPLFEVSPFASADVADLIAHINADHVPAMRRDLEQLGAVLEPSVTPVMLDVNPYGITLSDQKHPYFVAFPVVARTPEMVHEQLITLLS